MNIISTQNLLFERGGERFQTLPLNTPLSAPDWIEKDDRGLFAIAKANGYLQVVGFGPAVDVQSEPVVEPPQPEPVPPAPEEQQAEAPKPETPTEEPPVDTAPAKGKK